MPFTAVLDVDDVHMTATGDTRGQARVHLQRAWSAHVRERRGRTWRWVDVDDRVQITRKIR